jgi:hypothetical protein
MAFFGQGLTFGFQHSPSAAGFAPVLRLTIAIGAVFDDVFTITHSTMVDNCFLDHPSILLITYFLSITIRANSPASERAAAM